MPTVDIVVATYRGIAPEAYSSLIGMMQESNCFCRDPRTQAPLHAPWKCQNGKHSVRLMPPLFGSSVVHWARNQAICQALYGQPDDGRPQSDYLLLMDDDMVVQKHFLLRLMSYKTDIVCGICTVRRDPPMPNIRFWKPETNGFVAPFEWDWDAQKLIEIDAAGAAFMLVKRKVFERMGKAYLDCEYELSEDRRKMATAPGDLSLYWQECSRSRRERFNKAISEKDWKNADCWWFQFLDNAFEGQIGELGEDVSFCVKAKKLGFKIYADPQVLPGHLGMYGYGIPDYRDAVEQSKAAGQAPPLVDNRVGLVGAK